MRKSFIIVWLIVLILGLLGLFIANGGNLSSEFFIGSITTCAVTAVVLFIPAISNISLFTFFLIISGATLIMLGSASSGDASIAIRNGILVIIIVIAPVALMYLMYALARRSRKSKTF